MSRYKGPIVDVDVHHSARNDAEIIKYLPKQWQEYTTKNGKQMVPLTPPNATVGPVHESTQRLDAFSEGSFATNYDLMRSQLLDKYDYYRCILTHNLGTFSTHFNPYFASAVCSAANDWNIETWLSGRDERLYSVILAPLGSPEEAAKEVRRVGAHPRLPAVLISGNPIGKPIGDPIFHPVYQAASEMGLSIAVHTNNSDRPSNTVSSVGGAMTFAEMISQFSQQSMHYISSLIVHGVFEKYPNLHFTFKEYGIAWLPYVMLQLDQNYTFLKLESPWVKKWPSDYIRKHIRLSTQPIEESPDDKQGLAQLMQSVEGIEDILCFSSDYPHYSEDEPDYVARQLPSSWHRKVFCDNACEAFGWKPPV